MPTKLTHHCPFDRLWQPGHPFRPRHSRSRRWCMAVLLIFMSGVLSSYWFLTDPARLQRMSSRYLSELVGGDATVKSASLSLLEGLKLTKVSVYVENHKPNDPPLFYADDIEIQYNPFSLLRGQLKATRIIATGSRVELIEDVQTGRWNYQGLRQKKSGGPPTSGPSKPGPVPVVPQIQLRNAVVVYTQMQGSAGVSKGSISLEGRVFPSADGRWCRFEMSSMGTLDGVGPTVVGLVNLDTGAVEANLSNFKFGRDVEAMLPREVRRFWSDHHLQGELDIPEFKFTPARGNQKQSFAVTTAPRKVQFTLLPEELNPGPLRLIDRDLRLPVHFAAPSIPRPITVQDVSGTFRFDDTGVSLKNVTGTVADVTVSVSARMGGYSADAPVSAHVTTVGPLTIPEKIDYLSSLPKPARDVYGILKPHGVGGLWIDFDRPNPKLPPKVTGALTVLDGAMNCVFFPYPVRAATGAVTFETRDDGNVRVGLKDIHAFGIAGGPNESTDIHLTGEVDVVPGDVAVHIHGETKRAVAEPALLAALPPPAREALKIFQAVDGSEVPRFVGGCVVDVVVPFGRHVHPVVDVDLNFTDGDARLTAFPYPLHHLRGIVNVRDGRVDVHDVSLTNDRASVVVGGNVTWNPTAPDGVDPAVKPDLALKVRNVPIDDTLLARLPPDGADVVRKAGLTGLLDVDGSITSISPPLRGGSSADTHATPAKRVANGVGEMPVWYELNVTLHDGFAKPPAGTWEATDVAGRFVVTPEHLKVIDLQGVHGGGVVGGNGDVDLTGPKPVVTMTAAARRLPLDEPLKTLMPASAKDAWDELSPVGTADADLKWSAGDYKLTLRPLELSVTPKAVAYRLDHCRGSVELTPTTATLVDITGSHDKARIKLAGTAMTDHPRDWDLSLSAGELPVDKELLTALPPPLRKLLVDFKYKGGLSVDLTSLRYRGGESADRPNLDAVGTVRFKDAKLEAGAAVTGLTGGANFSTAVRAGSLAAFKGDIDIDAMSLVDRPIRGLKANVVRAPGSDTVAVTDIRGNVADGQLSGQVDLKFPDQGPGGYLLDLTVRQADVKTLAGQVAGKGKTIQGQVSASLRLRGDWGSPSSRQGRGDVNVSGKEMYQIPLVLGLMEVTNLSLPTTDPFNEGSAGYVVKGDRITFEKVQMRSSSLVMSGNGWLDFGTKKVRMNFTTENPNMPKLPLLGDVLAGARQELMQIQVRGTVQDPTVSAASMRTFTTTIDEVFSGKPGER